MTRTAIAALVACALLFPASAQETEKAKDVGPYTPKLADMMLLVQTRHIKLWLAGNGQAWDLARFQIEELEGTLNEVAKRYPRYRDFPMDSMIESIKEAQLKTLEEIVEARDSAKFTAAFDKLTAECNACHQSTDHGFVRIVRPAGSPFTDQSFAGQK